jgi:hypothetical protein
MRHEKAIQAIKMLQEDISPVMRARLVTVLKLHSEEPLFFVILF